MKGVITMIVFVLSVFNLFAQTEKEVTKSVALNQTEVAYLMLPGDVKVTEWDKPFIRVTTTIAVANMTDQIVERLIMVGRYSLESKEDKTGRMMVVKMPKVDHYVAVQGVNLVESYSFDVQAPEGYRVIVKEDLNPNVSQNVSLEQAI